MQAGDSLGGQRRPQLTRGELRTTLLEAGREILLEEGLDTDSSNLTFKRVFERVEQRSGVRITNASVIRRVWQNQADFQADVLVAIAHDEERPEAERTILALLALFERLDLSTAEARDAAIGEVCRIGGEASNSAIADSTSFSLWISVMAMATATAVPDERRRIQDALRGAYVTVEQILGGGLRRPCRSPRIAHPPTVDARAVREVGEFPQRGVLLAPAGQRPPRVGDPSDRTGWRGPGVDPLRGRARGARPPVLRDRPGVQAAVRQALSVPGNSIGIATARQNTPKD